MYCKICRKAKCIPPVLFDQSLMEKFCNIGYPGFDMFMLRESSFNMTRGGGDENFET